ncbi:hypothetical protein SLEP1_g49018 [Rubroshorea leprosula]|uniref:Uncharacterized protein n=1 Tax=Rubroshorea leprosula TaxID=152421 RepID=A0AAV5LVF4_9ROSI|nr:hypothetical protein SLEP1_g49018 [Rubroshorea leprosula]
MSCKTMKRSRRSNRVSWAPGVNLCQVYIHPSFHNVKVQIQESRKKFKKVSSFLH